jgi:hypothetical protein
MRPSVAVEGRATCPSPVEVQGRLADLMASIPDGAPQDRARIDPTDGGLHVDLLRDDGSRIAERVLQSAGSCADLASAAAVIVATWEAQLRAERLARIQLPAESRAPAQALTAVTVTPARGAPASSVEAGLGAVGSLAFGDAVEPAVGGLIFGTWSPRPTGLGLSAMAAGATARSASLSSDPSSPDLPGTVTTSWTRAFAAVGPVYRLVLGPARLDGSAALAAGLLYVSAAGLPKARSETSPDLGATLGVRLSTRWAPMAPWIGVQGLFWPVGDHIDITGISSSRAVPRLEAWLALGVSFGRSP